MNPNKYTIVTGYWSGNGWRGQDDNSKADFFKIWYNNTLKYSTPKDVFVINSGSDILPEEKLGKWIDLSFNLGHVHDLDHNDFYPKKFGGWSMTFMTACLLAYSNDSDLIFKEQDCLAFGPWVDQMYQDAEDQNVKMLVGRRQDANGQSLEQSLLLIKKEMLLAFTTGYLLEKGYDAGPGYVRPEQKFVNVIRDNFLNHVGSLSFGYGRMRPTEYDVTKPFYIQQISPNELSDLKTQNLV